MKIRPKFLDSATVIAPDGEKWEHAVYALPPYWFIEGYSDSTTDLDFYDDLNEVREIWSEIKDEHIRDLRF
jgi:hypothetical protein